jgi:hypothetical protein
VTRQTTPVEPTPALPQTPCQQIALTTKRPPRHTANTRPSPGPSGFLPILTCIVAQEKQRRREPSSFCPRAAAAVDAHRPSVPSVASCPRSRALELLLLTRRTGKPLVVVMSKQAPSAAAGRVGVPAGVVVGAGGTGVPTSGSCPRFPCPSASRRVAASGSPSPAPCHRGGQLIRVVCGGCAADAHPLGLVPGPSPAGQVPDPSTVGARQRRHGHPVVTG